MASPSSVIMIREIDYSSEEIAKVKDLYSKNLFLLDRLIFSGVLKGILKDQAAGNGAVLVAVDSALNEIVGTFSLRYFMAKGEKYGLIDCVAVAKSHRGQGITTQLLKSSLAWFHSQAVPNIYEIGRASCRERV